MLLLEQAEKEIVEKDGTTIWFNAREKAVNFYKKNGFQIIGSVFDVPSIGPHYLMYKFLN